jgi:hypothetical protein
MSTQPLEKRNLDPARPTQVDKQKVSAEIPIALDKLTGTISNLLASFSELRLRLESVSRNQPRVKQDQEDRQSVCCVSDNIYNAISILDDLYSDIAHATSDLET